MVFKTTIISLTAWLSKKSVSILLLFINCPFTIFSQPDYLQFDKLNNELSANIVNCIYQDSRGWMWFSTSQGLNKFDGINVTTYKNNPEDSTNLVGNLVRFIYEDSKGQLWIGTETGGLNLLNRGTEKFTFYPELDKNGKKIFYFANSIAETKTGDLWIGTNMGLKKLDRSSGKFQTFTNNPDKNNSLCDNYIKKTYIDRSGKIWLGTRQGLDCFNPVAQYFDHIPIFDKGDADQSICEIFEDYEGKIWVGTYAKGIYIIDPRSKNFRQLIPDKNNEYSFTVRSILQDKNGDYWIGTRAGLYIYSGKTNRFSHFEHDEKNPFSLCHNSILSLFLDNKNDIWIGTRGGISYLINEKQIFRHYSAYPNDNKYLNNSDIYAFWYGTDKSIWVGTDFGGINILDVKKQTFRYISENKNIANGISSNSIKSMVEDGKGNLWVGTYLGGINVYNLKTGNIIHYKNDPKDSGSIIDNRIWAICKDNDGIIWVGTGKGVDRYNAQTNKFIHYQNKFTNRQIDWISKDSQGDLWIGTNPDIFVFNSKTNSIQKFTINARTRAFCEDQRHRIWLCTGTKGILQFDRSAGTIKKYYDEQTGIASNSTFSIVEDNQETLWVGTANGLSRFYPDQERFRNFLPEDGTLIRHYNYGAGYKLPSGELLFGGFNGFILFNPKNISDNIYLPPVVFTDFRIFNKSLSINSGNSPLSRHISEMHRVVLKYNQNFISIKYIALNYSSPGKNRYAYKMDGVDKDWNYVGDKREAIYTSLQPGLYKFTVKASNKDNQWNQVGTSLEIQIIPPFYKTWFFRIAFILIIGLLISLTVYIRMRSIKDQNILLEHMVSEKTHDLQQLAIELEESQSEIMTQNEEIEKQNESLKDLNLQVNRQNEELKTYANKLEEKVKERTAELEIAKDKAEESSKLKSAILTNMSHEIRTPMNSIVGLSNLLMTEDLNADDKKFFTSNIKRNCDILLHLINDILDLSVIESGKMSLYFRPVNINSLLEGVYHVFETDKQWLEKAHINLKLVLPQDNLFATTDAVRLEQIIRNLVHNAFKFTDEGKIELGYKVTVLDIVFYVRDTGIGIPKDKINSIFERFVKLQDKSIKTDSGVGLGLAISSKLVKMIHGKIWVESELNHGSTFYVSIPITNVPPDSDGKL